MSKLDLYLVKTLVFVIFQNSLAKATRYLGMKNDKFVIVNKRTVRKNSLFISVS